MEGFPTEEQDPNMVWVQEAYDCLQQPGPKELPIDVRIAAVLDAYPDPPRQSGQRSLSALHIKFRHFAQTLLATSPNIDDFSERVGFLYSPDLAEYYAWAIDEPRHAQLVPNAAAAIDVSMEGLAGFCEQHPEDREQAVEYVAISLSPTRDTRLSSARRVLAHMVGVSVEEFAEQWAGGHFDDMPFTPKLRLAAECLARMGFGKLPRTLGEMAIYKAVYAPLDLASLYHLRNFNHLLADYLDARQRNEAAALPEDYAGRNAVKIFSDAYEMLRRAARFVNEQGSVNAGKILEGLPEPMRGTPPAQDRLLHLANSLVEPMNEVYFNNEFLLRRLDIRTNDSLPQAFDRILYVLRKELPPSGNPDQDAKNQETLELVSSCIANLIELGHLKMNDHNPITVGDIIAMYPDAAPETLQTIITAAQERLGRKRSSGGHDVYADYKAQVRNARYLRWKRRKPGSGLLS